MGWSKRNLVIKISQHHELSYKESQEIIESVLTEVRRTIVDGGRIPNLLTSKGIGESHRTDWLRAPFIGRGKK